MTSPASWVAQSDRYKKKERAQKRAKTLSESSIEKAIQQAFLLRHRLPLEKMDAGGSGTQKGTRMAPKSLLALLGLPEALPWGLQVWVGIPPGFPDLMGDYRGRSVFIEVKKPGGTFREGQKAFLEAARAMGAIAFHARSVDEALAKFEAALEGRAA